MRGIGSMVSFLLCIYFCSVYMYIASCDLLYYNGKERKFRFDSVSLTEGWGEGRRFDTVIGLRETNGAASGCR